MKTTKQKVTTLLKQFPEILDDGFWEAIHNLIVPIPIGRLAEASLARLPARKRPAATGMVVLAMLNLAPMGIQSGRDAKTITTPETKRIFRRLAKSSSQATAVQTYRTMAGIFSDGIQLGLIRSNPFARLIAGQNSGDDWPPSEATGAVIAEKSARTGTGPYSAAAVPGRAARRAAANPSVFSAAPRDGSPPGKLAVIQISSTELENRHETEALSIAWAESSNLTAQYKAIHQSIEIHGLVYRRSLVIKPISESNDLASQERQLLEALKGMTGVVVPRLHQLLGPDSHFVLRAINGSRQ